MSSQITIQKKKTETVTIELLELNAIIDTRKYQEFTAGKMGNVGKLGNSWVSW